MKLMLSHPYWSVDELFVVESALFDSFAVVYDCCLEVYAGMYEDDFYGEVLPSAEEEGFEEEPEAEYEQLNDADWQLLAGELPNCGLDAEDVELLGNREVDCVYDWSPYIGRYSELLGC